MKRKCDGDGKHNGIPGNNHIHREDCNRLFILLSVDILLNIMSYLDLQSFQTVCIMLYKRVGIPLYDGKQSWPIPELNPDQKALINQTAIVFDQYINVHANNDWMYMIVHSMMNELKPHSYTNQSSKRMHTNETIKTLKSIQTSINDITLGRMLDFCRYSLCYYCKQRRALHEYFGELDRKLSLCLGCKQQMEDTMFTTDINSDYLVSGRAWVSFTALSNAFSIKRTSLLEILKDANIRQYPVTTSSKGKFYLLSDFIGSRYFSSPSSPPKTIVQEKIDYRGGNYIEIDDTLP
jgi:hypothetical protein